MHNLPPKDIVGYVIMKLKVSWHVYVSLAGKVFKSLAQVYCPHCKFAIATTEVGEEKVQSYKFKFTS